MLVQGAAAEVCREIKKEKQEQIICVIRLVIFYSYKISVGIKNQRSKVRWK